MTENKTGRPLLFKTVEDLQLAVDAYFVKGNAEDNIDFGEAWVELGDSEYQFMPTMSGLALALGVDRKTITNYANKQEFFPTIKKARNIVEQTLERRLYLNNPAGTIFNLKNNFGWADKSEINIESPNGTMTPTFVFNPVGSDEPTDTD